MSQGIRGNPHAATLEWDGAPTARSAAGSARGDGVIGDTPTATIADGRQWRDPSGKVARRSHATREGLIEALMVLSDRCVALEARNGELAAAIEQLRASRPIQTRTFRAGDDERRRLERDLHDGVQNELVALIVMLARAGRDPATPRALAGTLAELVGRGEAALHSVREIAHGIYPSTLTVFGIYEALRAQATRTSLAVSLNGTAPRSTEEAEVAVYFSCLEAIQNVAKHAGADARVTLRLQHHDGTLGVLVADDGDGFDSARIASGGGLRNIRDRIQTLGGTVELASTLGRGTVLSLSLPWPSREPNTDPDRSATFGVATTSTTVA